MNFAKMNYERGIYLYKEKNPLATHAGVFFYYLFFLVHENEITL